MCQQFFGARLVVEVESADQAPQAEQQRAAQTDLARRRRQQALDHPAVNDTMEILGGEIVDIRPSGWPAHVTGPDLNQILEQARQMQTNGLRKCSASWRAPGRGASSGGGMVTAVASGRAAHRRDPYRAEPARVRDRTPCMLPDLVVAAVNAALSEAQRTVSEELARVAGPGLGIPGMPGPG